MITEQKKRDVALVVDDSPETLRLLFSTAIRVGASRLCIADTVGHATPNGARALVNYVKALLHERGADHVGIDWHGHRDRGFGVASSLAALEAGATRLHGAALGIGIVLPLQGDLGIPGQADQHGKIGLRGGHSGMIEHNGLAGGPGRVIPRLTPAHAIREDKNQYGTERSDHGRISRTAKLVSSRGSARALSPIDPAKVR